MPNATRPSSTHNPEVLYQDERVCIRYTPGTIARGVCVFADLPERLGGSGEQVLSNAVREHAPRMHHFDIVDRRGSWFNDAFNTIFAVIKSTCIAQDIHSLMTLGEGMGGFGALVFLDALPFAHRGAAFNAHSSMHPERVGEFEHRWGPMRQRIQQWHTACLTERWSRKELYLLYGAQAQEDVQHAARLRPMLGEAQRMVHVEDMSTDLVYDFQHHGRLGAVLDALFARSNVEARLSEILEEELLTEEFEDELITEPFELSSITAAK